MSRARLNLAEERLNRGMSIPQAAEAIGVTEEILRRTESGGRPHPQNALKIATFYDRRVTDIWPLEPDELAA